MKIIHFSPLRRRLLAIVAASVWTAAAIADEHSALPDPADAGAVVPPATYVGVLPDDARDYLERNDAPRLPWPRLFAADGRFAQDIATDPVSAQSPASPHAGHAMATPGMTAAPDTGSPAGGRDARGVVRAVDVDTGRVTIKHGPIERLEMPGMTMVFRVRDRALLEGIEPGAEVGFDVDLDGTVFYVTGFGK